MYRLRTNIRFNSIRKKSSISAFDRPNALDGNELPAPVIDIPFSRAKIGSFMQVMPKLGNQFTADITLQNYLKYYVPSELYTAIEPDLCQFGERVANDIYDLHIECETNSPYLKTYDPWGKRIDTIITCPAWKEMKKISAIEGLIALGYERKQSEWSRLYQISKLYLYSPSSGLFGCPLAMTDGAAKILENVPESTLPDQAYKHLTSRDPNVFWTSGQWMTEKKGGSDVANATETVAVCQSDGSYRLYGYKWFTSATDSDIALTLARLIDRYGNTIPGTSGLSMFYVKVRNSDGSLNNMEVQRLKDKLGTRQLPTAELLLDNVKAYRISDDGRGIASIAHMLTLTRIHNSLMAASSMRRILSLARDYSHKRHAFGQLIKDHPLHIKTIAGMEVEARAATLLVLDMARLLGHEELGLATDNQKHLLRLLTPITKLYTAKQAMQVVSEGLECFGGAGYLEDTGLPSILRDCQVLTIWEGTTNVLSLDTLRAIYKTKGAALVAWQTAVGDNVNGSPTQLSNEAEKLIQCAHSIMDFSQTSSHKFDLAARDLAYSLARVYMGSLLVKHSISPIDQLVAQRWCEKDLCPVLTKNSTHHFKTEVCGDEYELVMDGYIPIE